MTALKALSDIGAHKVFPKAVKRMIDQGVVSNQRDFAFWACVHLVAEAVELSDVEFLRHRLDRIIQHFYALDAVNTRCKDDATLFLVGDQVIPVIFPDHRIRRNGINISVAMWYGSIFGTPKSTI